jgi:hypothetical protein
MTTKAEKDRQKQIQEKCQALLTQMLRDEDNKYCVDCDAKGKFKWTYSSELSKYRIHISCLMFWYDGWFNFVLM